LEKRAEQVLLGNEGDSGEREEVGGRGQREETDQTIYAHMNK
jgi:hypothetical protein